MKFDRQLIIDGKELRLVTDVWTLELGVPGRAVLTVLSPEPVSGLVTYSIGWNGQRQRWFIGYVECSQQMDVKQQRVSVREVSGALAARCPLSRRNVTALEVLADIAAATGVEFIAGDLPSDRLSHVVNVGTGQTAIGRLGAQLRIADWVCQAMPEGQVYVGSLSGLKPPTITVPPALFGDVTTLGAGLQAVPRIRPGAVLCIGNGTAMTVTKVELRDSAMRLGWKRA